MTMMLFISYSSPPQQLPRYWETCGQVSGKHLNTEDLKSNLCYLQGGVTAPPSLTLATRELSLNTNVWLRETYPYRSLKLPLGSFDVCLQVAWETGSKVYLPHTRYSPGYVVHGGVFFSGVGYYT